MIDDPTNPLDYTCPTCEAEPGAPCVTKDAKPASHLHDQRLALAAVRDAERNPSKAPTL